MVYIRPNFAFSYNGVRLCLNDASEWAFALGKLYDGAYDDILTNLNGMDEWEDSVFPWEKERTEKKRTLSPRAKRSQRRRANKKHHISDRYHGKCFEGRTEDGKQIYKDRYCRFPVSDRVRNHSALKAEAREQDYLAELAKISESEEEEFFFDWEEEEKQDSRILDNHYRLEKEMPAFGKNRYISLISFWNGERWEDSRDAFNQFKGIKSAEEVKDMILAEQADHNSLPKIKVESVHDSIGTSLNWEDLYGNEDGYVKLTFLPID